MPEIAGISESRWTDLLDLIEMGKVIPIVGRRMSLVETGDGPPAPFQTVVEQRLAKELGVDPLPADWGLTRLYMSAADRDTYNVDAFHFKLKRVLGGMQPHLEPLRKIAEISHFKLFLSITIDGYLEQAVREVRGACGETVASFTFAPGYESPQRPLGQYGDVVVYNLIGSRDTCPNWAVTVEGLVEFVLGLQGEKYRPEKLFDALKDHHLLAIGCQIPDWLGRFFLRSLRGGPISAQQTANILVEDQRDADTAFGHYLELFSKKSFLVPGDALAFADELNRRWKERVACAPPPPAHAMAAEEPLQSAGKVFISYSHADRARAQELYDFLRAQRIDVWKDDRDDAIEKGSNWNSVIARQIADCACFVPLISRHTETVSESYFWNEWNLALKRHMQMDSHTRRFIFPVLCEAGVSVPEQFRDMQWSLLTDPDDRQALAASLRKEQQNLRKERR